jgi:hypothetical protein
MKVIKDGSKYIQYNPESAQLSKKSHFYTIAETIFPEASKWCIKESLKDIALVLISGGAPGKKKNIKTSGHLDQNSADNIALAIKGVGIDKILATWLFMDIDCFLAMDKALDGKLLKRDTTVTQKQMLDAYKPEMGRMIVIKQRHLHIVHVPPNWPHAVFTHEPCVKVAIEVVEIQFLIEYIEAWMKLRAPMAEAGFPLADDYTHFMQAMMNYAMEKIATDEVMKMYEGWMQTIEDMNKSKKKKGGEPSNEEQKSKKGKK